MSIREVTYYQAKCDMCGVVDNEGDYSAWADADSARMEATGSEWTEIEVTVSDDVTGAAVYRVSREGQEPFNQLSVLICRDHTGYGIHWCATCEEDLDESGWTHIAQDDAIGNVCPEGHANFISLAAGHE